MGRYERFDPATRVGSRRSYLRLIGGLDLDLPGRRGWRTLRVPFALLVVIAACAMFFLVFAAPDVAGNTATSSATASAPEHWTGRFGICRGPARHNCVVDGDTFWIDGEKVRIADIDTPELHPARCDEEERLGRAAKSRLHELLNGGQVALHGIGSRDRDRYGRLLRTVSVDMHDIGDMLIAEGLARPYAGGRRTWC